MEIVAGFDPGLTTGFAIISISGKKITPVRVGEIKNGLKGLQEFNTILSEVNHVAIEGFLVRPKNARQGSFDWDPMIAPQVIAQLRTLCELSSLPYKIQQPSIKPVGYGFANQKYQAGKKGTHSQDALAHAVYYAVTVLGAHPVKTS
jgi:hypothetical protein